MPMNISEIFLIAILVILAIPCLFWRLGRTEYYAFVFRAPMLLRLRGVVGAPAEQRAATACMAGSWLISSALP